MSPTQTAQMMRKIDCAAVSLLVVEDNDASRRLVLELLRAAGFSNVNSVRNAEEAIEQIQAIEPDLLLLDWGLPGMSGIDLVTEIRQSAITPDPRFVNPQLPIVMLTARQRARDVTQARNAGVNEFIIKPFSTASLLKGISSALVKTRDFVTASSFIGPDRRRRKAGLYPGLLKRADDMPLDIGQLAPTLAESLSAEMSELRNVLRLGPNRARVLNSKTLSHITARMIQAQSSAHDFRMRLITQATRSLNDYVRLFAHDADPEVLDVHLDALIRLNDAPFTSQDEAVNIVKHLNTLVTKRKLSRKVPQ